VHVNALFVTTDRIAWPAVGAGRLERYDAALQVTRALGGIAQLNHPNYDWAADAQLISELGRRGLQQLEVANMSGVANEGRGDFYASTARRCRGSKCGTASCRSTPRRR
jgi:hypothetical protein